MNWRLASGILGGVLLSLPLVLLIAGSMLQRPHTPFRGDVRFAPVLSHEERQRLQTYHHPCRDSPCESPLACLSDTRVMGSYCTDSQCETDAQCPAGFTCVPLRTANHGPLVRDCITWGVRKEGESCFETPPAQEDACEPGLRCAEGWCGRPCALDNPASCPEEFFCADVFPGPTCRPTCEGRTCPEGQQCMRDTADASVCAVHYGPDCQRVPCPEGRKCEAIFPAKHQGSVWTECFPECGEGRPPCPEGLICDMHSCLKPCELNGPNVCDPGFRCQRYADSQPWACRPDY
jgi:hypothetical protein